MSETDGITARAHAQISSIAAVEWDACANLCPEAFNPFLSHAFLKALEDAGTVGRGTGWFPQHLVLTSETGNVLACMPLYLKTHSQGEYVFDHAWADALHRAGGEYYPKLQCAVPFTPVPGRRLLVKPQDAAEETVRLERVLAASAVGAAAKLGASSLHITFATESEWQRLGETGFLRRSGQQFHWANEGYATFEDFLASLSSRKRKALRKERETAQAGVTIEHLTGRDITEAHWDFMYKIYMDTGSRKWGRPYLNRRFFSLLGETMAERCLLVFAKRNGSYIAGALHLIGGDCLYGRYWGALDHVPCLHFELCYYQAIDYAIANRLKRAEAGAQGEHKLARGYLPVTTYSLHWFREPALERAVANYLDSERLAVKEANEELSALGPFRRGPLEDG